MVLCNYEKCNHYTLTHRNPVIIRVDGRAFHTFTRKSKKPFDEDIMDAMVHAARKVAEDMQGFKLAYVQSDEATFCLTDYDDEKTQGWFDYDLAKMVSISASLMSVHFNDRMKPDKLQVFDSRAFSVPESDIANVFLWRAKDWERNSLQMYARSFFSHKQLHGKKHLDIHDMLHDIGANWTTDLSERERNGTYLLNTDVGIIETNDVLPRYKEMSDIVSNCLMVINQ